MKGRPPRARSPQEKKALSYAKDRRNAYWENDKASRKGTPRRKAAEHRTSRRSVAQDLAVLPRLEDVPAEVAESTARQDIRRLGGWKKKPDVPLRDHVATQLRLRIQNAHHRRLQ